MRASLLRTLATAVPVFALALGASREARATNITEFPDNGSEQMGRGGAWVARASDPLAVAFNPAGLAGQRTALTLQANLTLKSSCYTRLKAADDKSSEPGYVDAGQSYPEVCAEKHVFPNPQVAFNYRVNDRIGAAIAVLGPSGVGESTWPTFVDSAAGQQPAPNRYLLIEGKSLFLTPTIGMGVEVADGFRIGGALSWGVIKAKFNNASPALNQDNLSPRTNDIDATLIVADYFVPGFNLGALYSPTSFLDVGAFYKWSDSIKASGDVYTRANAYTPQVAAGNKNGIVDGDTSLSDCNFGQSAAGLCGSGDNAKLTLPVPMEARIGVRYHQLRGTAKPHTRDPMAEDVFDAEVDFTWANNSAFDSLQIRFPGSAAGEGIIPVNGTPGVIPPNADVPHKYKDVLGVRLGGDINVLPNQLALRLGGYYETKGQDERYQNIDFIGASRFGLAAGGTYRVPVGTASLDLMLGFMHVFVADSKNNGPDGVYALAGTKCNPPTAPCSADKAYRTNWPVNLGTMTNALNVFNLGAAYKF